MRTIFRFCITLHCLLALSLIASGCSSSRPVLEVAPVAVYRSAPATIPGYDVLGVARYCQRFQQAPKLPAVSTLLNTFGDPLPCIEKRIQQGGLRLVQVDLIDATCWRNNKCPPGVPRPDNLKEIEKRARQVDAYAQKYPQIEWWVSPALEDDVRDVNKKRAMLEAAQRGCPRCKVINSPFTGAKPPGYPIEKHGTKVEEFSVSGDGASIFDGDNIRSDGNKFEHRTSGKYTTFAWWNELNLRCTGEKNFTPPKQRTAKPTADQFRQAYMNMMPEPPQPAAPPQCKSVRDVTKPEITKPNAEAYCNGQQQDKRGNKPLLILRKAGKKGQRIKVRRSDGKEVACFQYYDKFSEPGLHRWYMGDCSGHAPAQLFDALGGEWGFADLGGGKCLRFNAIRRQGVYR